MNYINIVSNTVKYDNILPSHIPGCTIWLDASDLSTITKDGSDKVSIWNDKSPLAHSFTQAVGTAQPTWINDGIHGRATVRFDGSDTLSAGDQDDIYSVNSGFSAYIVARYNVSSNFQMFLSKHAGSTNGTFFVARNSGVSGRLQFSLINSGSTRVDLIGDGYNGSTGLNLITIEYDNSEMTMRLPDYSIAGGPTALNGPMKNSARTIQVGNYEGASYPLDGDVSEIVCFSRKLNDLERTTLSYYLKRGWGV